ncbi:beta/gamma crystallin domain-containing protein [Methylomonas rhizoryzae]|uniref:beta/gamma crystallin domain-containing protein n=1 Tax=Methylomonas rhizoryzae TaxID=2608981 RepID=UPI001232CA10|nr:beta/gamma crystallin domain-containing protein [Methylomonas rhizoryzae]
MNNPSIKTIWGKTIVLIGILATSVSSTQAEDGCWADFFSESQYGGDSFRLKGTQSLNNLRNVQGKDWDSRISSLKIGPNARVVLFENLNFKLTLKEMEKYPELLKSLGLTEKDAMEDKELLFGADSHIHDLSDFNFRKKTRSLQITCN